ncbi:MAG: DUF6359 domain-containing protein [Prevotella sp.]|nr:DUF6359 domain-containing protein [Prevotella sp.]
MKKIFNLLSTAIIAFGISACSDVPAPYDINDSGTGGGDNSTYINESFASSFGSFTVKTVKGIDWVIDFSTAKASGYNNSDKTNTESDSYLVSKTIDLSESTGAYIEFDYILRYASSGTNKLLITDNYTNDPTTTTWTDITGKLTEGSDWTTFESYAKNIPAEFIGKKAVNIAFHYTASSSNSATWEVKNLKVKEGKVEETEEPVPDGGTRDNPFDVATAKSAAQGQTGWVKGYIVGWVDGQSYSEGAKFSVPTEAQTEILIAPTADETNADNCMPVQLPVGDIRTALELSKNTGLYKKEVLLYGSLEKYFGQGGLKSTSAAVIDGNLVGKDPDSTTPDVPAGEQKGDGTKESPYNVAKAQAITIALAADVASEKVYISGTISEIKNIDTGQYGNAEYYISDDGTTNNQFLVYRGFSLGGKKFTSANEIKVGDKVVIYGSLINFKGNTPEVTTGSTIYSLNGKTEGGGTEEPGGGDNVDPTGDGSRNNPFNISAAQATDGKTGWVKGYIVGWVDGTKYSEGTKFDIPTEAQTEIVIAPTATETNVNKCIPVQLPKGDIRTSLDLFANPGIHKKEVLLYGKITKYFGVMGLKETSAAVIDGKLIGTDPDK